MACNTKHKNKLLGIIKYITPVNLLKIIYVFLIIGAIQAIANLNPNYSKAIDALLNNNYKEAIGYFIESNDYTEIQKNLAKSNEKYREGMRFYKMSDNKSAYDLLSQVDILHPKYEESQKIIAEIMPPLGREYLAKAKDSYGKKNYSEADHFIRLSLIYDPSVNETIELSELYHKKYIEITNDNRIESQQVDAQTIREKMGNWEGDEIKIAIPKAFKKNVRELRPDITGNSTYVYVNIAVMNLNLANSNVNPMDFTLATSTGHTVPLSLHTFTLSNALHEGDLCAGQETRGYLAFNIANDSRYTLIYSAGLNNSVKELTF